MNMSLMCRKRKWEREATLDVRNAFLVVVTICQTINNLFIFKGKLLMSVI